MAKLQSTEWYPTMLVMRGKIKGASQGLSVLALLVSLFALGIAFANWRGSHTASVEATATRPGLLQRIEKTGELHAGYGVYPPYTTEDPNTRAVSGFSVELLELIARELKCKVVWHRLNWNTMTADLKRGEYDVIADPVFQTVPRAREFAFSEPYAYFADGVGVVRTAESRFKQFQDIDKNGITIAVGQGWASESFLRARVVNARIVPVQTGTDLLQVFNEVLSGRADIAIADGADASRFVKEHPTEVKTLWLDDPPSFMPAGFALRPDDTSSADFLTVSLRNLRSTGVLSALAKKYGVRLSAEHSK